MSRSKLYTRLMNAREWRDLRTAKLTEDPLCEVCRSKGLVVAASVVHHLIEVESGRTEQECRQLAYSWNNLQSLCRECHSQIHQELRSHSREAHRRRSEDRMAQWIARHDNNHRPGP